MRDQVEISIKYAGYIARQENEVARLESPKPRASRPRSTTTACGDCLSRYVRTGEQRPETIGQASRISGVTPAAISLLLVHIKRLATVKAGLQRNLQPKTFCSRTVRKYCSRLGRRRSYCWGR